MATRPVGRHRGDCRAHRKILQQRRDGSALAPVAAWASMRRRQFEQARGSARRCQRSQRASREKIPGKGLPFSRTPPHAPRPRRAHAGVEFVVDQRVQQTSASSQVISLAPVPPPCRPQHGAGGARRDITVPRAPRDVGDLAVRQILDLSQHKVSRNGSSAPAISRRTVSASQRRTICASGVSGAPARAAAGSAVSGQFVDAAGRRAGASGIFGAADIAQDRQQPRLDRRSAIGVEMLQRAQVTFLHRVFGIRRVAQQIARQRVDVVETGAAAISREARALSGSLSETLTGIAFAGAHRCIGPAAAGIHGGHRW